MSLIIKNGQIKYFRKEILKNLNLEFKEDKIYGIIGPNGSGKTSFMRGLYNLVKMTGEISLGNKLQKNIRNEISYISPEMVLMENLTPIEYIKLYKSFFCNFNKEVFLEMIKILNIDEDKKIKEFSTGLKTRLRIALGLSRDCHVFLLDEPFLGIDHNSKKAIIKSILGRISDNSIILLTSHLLNEITFLIDEAYFIKDKTIKYVENLEVAREKGNSLEDIYLEVYNDEHN